jgi:hypothetical protein
MKMKNIVTLCILGLLIGIGGSGCRRSVSSGSRNFSFNFDGKKEDAIAIVVKMHDSICQELEKRDFKKLTMTETLEMKGTDYEGQYDGFPVTVKIHYLLAFSEEEPELSYRVSFEKTTAVDELDEAAKDFRALMSEWCDHTKLQ